MANPISVGPIVGYTTPTSVRLWGRGEAKKKPKPNQNQLMNCYGIARLINETDQQVIAAQSFPMLPHFDFTGVVEFLNLTPNTKYSYQMGFIDQVAALPDPLPVPNPNDFHGLKTHHFQTAVTSNTHGSDEVSFVFGSCRYLLKLFGASIFDSRGDKTFRSIIGQLEAKRRTDFFLMMGDQIYADDLNFLFPDDSASEFHKRYQEVFSQEHIRDLMSRVPTYMMMDDHEIQNDWSMDEYQSKHTLYNVAMSAYQSYQLVHGPAFTPHQQQTDLSSSPIKRYYSFSVGSAHLFILDTRTERYKKTTPPQMISQHQMEALKSWLALNKDSLKFIGTSVPFFPDYRHRSNDKWSGFTEQRDEILDFIRMNQIRKVVFLAGDIHQSGWATLKCPTDSSFQVHSIISSAFYWPYPVESKEDFLLNGELTQVNGHRFVVEAVGGFRAEDNFTRVTSENDLRLLVEVFERKGKKIDATYLPLL